MTYLREEQTIKFETTEAENKKTGKIIITSVAITSSNGMCYKITNRKDSKSRTNLYLSYKNKTLMNGFINSSASRADSFANCEHHLLFKLSPEELDDFFLKYGQNVGTLFVKENVNAINSYFWIKRKLYIMTDDNQLKMTMVELAGRHRKLNVMENFVITNSTAKQVRSTNNFKSNLTAFELYTDLRHIVFRSIYDSSNNTGTFNYLNEPRVTVDNLNPSKYKVMLNDYLVKWTVTHPKGQFENIVNDYGFTDDMTYNQVKKMLRMIKI